MRKYQFPIVLNFFYLLVALELAILIALVIVIDKALRDKDEFLTLDVISTSPHFVNLVSLFQLHNELLSACKMGYCLKPPSWSWSIPSFVSIFFDVFLLKRVDAFHEEGLFRAITICMIASSCAVFLWTVVMYVELRGGI